jgi:hypothetical protein
VSPIDFVDSAGATSCQGEAAVSSSSHGSGVGSSSCVGQPLVVSYLPEPQLAPPAAVAACADGSRRTSEAVISSAAAVQVQLLEPQPGTLLVADRWCFFKVLTSHWSSVAVGTQQCGWQVLQPIDATEASLEGSVCGVAAVADGSAGLAVFAGSVYLPRVSACFVAVQDTGHQGQAAAGAVAGLHAGSSTSRCTKSSWEPVLGLRVLPPVRLVITVVSACGNLDHGEPCPSHPHGQC